MKDKIIFVSNKDKTEEQVQKEIDALKFKLKSFENAEVQKGYANAAAALKGKVVLAQFLPANLIAAADTFLEAQTAQGITPTIMEMLTAEQIANTIQFVNVFRSHQIDFKKWMTMEASPEPAQEEEPEGEASEAE